MEATTAATTSSAITVAELRVVEISRGSGAGDGASMMASVMVVVACIASFGVAVLFVGGGVVFEGGAAEATAGVAAVGIHGVHVIAQLFDRCVFTCFKCAQDVFEWSKILIGCGDLHYQWSIEF